AYYYGKDKKIVDSTDTKVRTRQSFGVLEKTNCPAVLVEQCFITNNNDVAQWTGENGCKKAAEIYYSAIKQYFQQEI
ncbi:MAG: N-acetylmuramoyl-L-alanine amidase, partial [Oscillospiraceae bacterium]|nr:N-acetylmuramoyl-L-alanine amidase [Oscillospiraceae bacterium]